MTMNKIVRATAKLRVKLTFASWCKLNAAAYKLPLGLNADVVQWIVYVMQSGGEMQAIEGITALTKALTLRRTKLRFPTELEWDTVMLTARVLLRTWEQ
jgi:hypothetical protein